MNKKGRLIIEFVLAVGLSSFLLSGAVALLRLGYEQQILLSAARLGTLLQSRAGVDEQTARAEVLRRLREENVEDVLITTGRYLEGSAAHFYNLVRTRLEKGPLVADVICEREGE